MNKDVFEKLKKSNYFDEETLSEIRKDIDIHTDKVIEFKINEIKKNKEIIMNLFPKLSTL